MKNPGWMAGVGSCAMVVNLPPNVRECHSRTSVGLSLPHKIYHSNELVSRE